ncbi:MAG TPA: archaellin/type IV pilin N-terminal domain-containing protein [Methanomicrobiales archaeon]|nr:archaellin/type IV pilin N-terminal domain-containing protein [Methanomicrobiales archaeon]
MKKFQKLEAFTGLEAAIVLIAFVVVAAVFSYVVLGAGFFTTQQAQKVVYSGISQASSNIVIIGEVYGDASGTSQGVLAANNPGVVHTLIFTLGLAAGGSPVDMNQTVLVFENSTTLRTLDYASNINLTSTGVAVTPAAWQWGILSKQNANSNNLLEANEQFTIMANVSSSVSTTSTGIPPSDQFTLQVRPPVGAALPITKEAPGGITPLNLLY